MQIIVYKCIGEQIPSQNSAVMNKFPLVHCKPKILKNVATLKFSSLVNKADLILDALLRGNLPEILNPV